MQVGRDARLNSSLRRETGHSLVLAQENVHGGVSISSGIVISRRDVVIATKKRQATSTRILTVYIAMTLNDVTDGQCVDVERQRVEMNAIFLEDTRQHSEIKIWICPDKMRSFVVQPCDVGRDLRRGGYWLDGAARLELVVHEALADPMNLLRPERNRFVRSDKDFNILVSLVRSPAIHHQRVRNGLIITGDEARGFRVETNEKRWLVPCISGLIDHALTLAYRRDTRHVSFLEAAPGFEPGWRALQAPA